MLPKSATLLVLVDDKLLNYIYYINKIYFHIYNILKKIE